MQAVWFTGRDERRWEWESDRQHTASPGFQVCFSAQTVTHTHSHNEILLDSKMYLFRFKTDSMFHWYDIRSKSDLFISCHITKLFEQIIAYNGALIDNKFYHEINSFTYIMRFKKMNINFLLENDFYFVEEYMAIDPYSIKIVLMVFTLKFFVIYTSMFHLISISCCFI